MSTMYPIGHRPAVLRLASVGVTLALAAVLMGPALVAAATPPTIDLLASTYSPAIITVDVGTKVHFKNTSELPHTATADDGSFDTGMIDPGASASIVLKKAGQIVFHCQFHGAAGGVGQSGTIMVTAAAVEAPPSATPEAAVGATPRPTKPAAGGTTSKIDPPASDTRLGVPGPIEGLPLVALVAASVVTTLFALGLDGARRALRRRTGG